MPHPGGRPPFQPTDQDRATVKNMAAAGINQDLIRRCISGKINDKTFRKHFREELDLSATLVTGFAMSKLFACIQKGEAWAICFWLKCKANFQETTAVNQRLVDANGNDRSPLNVVFVGVGQTAVAARGKPPALALQPLDPDGEAI